MLAPAIGKAQDFDYGQAAAHAGDYDIALQELQPLAVNRPGFPTETLFEDMSWDKTQPANFTLGPDEITSKKVGRNDPCLCGSGRKYKKCCRAN